MDDRVGYQLDNYHPIGLLDRSSSTEEGNQASTSTLPNKKIPEFFVGDHESISRAILDLGVEKTANPQRIVILGCGVSGLSTGLLLLEAGHNVIILAKDIPPNTTSNKAGAVWYPHRADPVERVTPWGDKTFQTFKKMNSIPGVSMRHVIELLPEKSPDPEWSLSVDNFVNNQKSPRRGYGASFEFDAPVIDMNIYLDYLVKCFKAMGGTIEKKTVHSIDEIVMQHKIVVNCTGLGSQELVGDYDLHPARGQVVRIDPNGVEDVLIDIHGPKNEPYPSDALAYAIPTGSKVVLGGSEKDWSNDETVNDQQTQEILKRMIRLNPAFKNIRIQEVVAGLRPVRSTIVLDADTNYFPNVLLIHNYGHGGAGVTLSWGCAYDVYRKTEDNIQNKQNNIIGSYSS